MGTQAKSAIQNSSRAAPRRDWADGLSTCPGPHAPQEPQEPEAPAESEEPGAPGGVVGEAGRAIYLLYSRIRSSPSMSRATRARSSGVSTLQVRQSVGTMRTFSPYSKIRIISTDS